jgi:hypothetical protein
MGILPVPHGARLVPSEPSYPDPRPLAQAESPAAATRLLNRPGGLFYLAPAAQSEASRYDRPIKGHLLHRRRKSSTA